MPTYIATDGRDATRMFTTEPDALIYWYYNSCRGYLHLLQDGTGILLDQANRDTSTWKRSGKQLDTGDQVQTATINNYKTVSHIMPPGTILPDTIVIGPSNIVIATVPYISDVVSDENIQIIPIITRNSENVITVNQDNNNIAEEIKRLRTFVTISDAEITKKHEELEEVWRVELEERNKIEQQRQSIVREKQKEEEAEKIFESGKQTYRQLKREIATGLTTSAKLPEQFMRRYMVYKRMDDKGLLDLDGDWEHYQDITDQLKEEEFESDKIIYLGLKAEIESGECKESDVPLDFENQYRVFGVMDQQGIIDSPDSFDMFITLLGEYMSSWNDCKYSLSNDAHYLEDVNINPREANNNNNNSSSDNNNSIALTAEQAREKYGLVAGPEAADQLENFGSYLK